MQKAHIGNETLYNGISRIWGGWMMTTEGDPITAYDLEEAVADNPEMEDDIDRIYQMIGGPCLEWEECSDEDYKYVEEWLKIWGI